MEFFPKSDVPQAIYHRFLGGIRTGNVMLVTKLPELFFEQWFFLDKPALQYDK